MPSIDLKDQYFGCEIEMTGLTRQQAAEAVASLFGTTAVHSRSSRTYDPWEVTDNEGKTWRFVYDSSIHGSHRTGRQQIPIGDGDYKVEMNSPKLEYSAFSKKDKSWTEKAVLRRRYPRSNYQQRGIPKSTRIIKAEIRATWTSK